MPRYEFIKRDISWQSPVFFTPVDKQGELKEAELEALILAQYRAAGIAPQAVDSGAIIITGESAKTRNARPAVMALSQSLGDFVVASAGPHLESVIAGHGAGAQTLSRQRMCRVLNIDIGGGTSNYALFDAGNLSATACLNVGGRLLETDAQGACGPRALARTADCRCGIRPGNRCFIVDCGSAGAGGAPDGGADR
ncbi:ethanolamine ammonia-lyase reactivating factor EutA [Klebsiella variicola subsp. variicola]|nr:ethanolamine ammonia-lyase reactivating factor EutA [Klebsiella variicola subsp. variicola]